MITTKQLRERAAKRIQRYGWTKGRYGSERVGYCMLGALIHESIDQLPNVAGDVYLETVEELMVELYTDPVDFNDKFAASAEQVIDALLGKPVVMNSAAKPEPERELALV